MSGRPLRARPGRARRVFLGLCLAIPPVIAALWGGALTDSAYAGFRRAENIAAGQGWAVQGLAWPLVVASLLHLPLHSAAVLLSTTGWIIAVLGWFLIGLKLEHPTFSVGAAVLLALHPLQGRALGLEPGLVMGLLAMATYLVVQDRLVGALIIVPVLVVIGPLALSFLVPLLVFSWIRRGSGLRLEHVTVCAAISVACYVVAAMVSGRWDDPSLTTSFLAVIQVLVAAGISISTRRLSRWPLSNGVAALCLAALVLGQTSVLVQGWRLRPVDRSMLYETLAQWLKEEALPDETVGVRDPAHLGYLSGYSTIRLPDTGHTSVLLATIERMRPDYCVALGSLAWQGAVRQPWFQERYEQVHQFVNSSDSATSLTVYRYVQSRFDEGDFAEVSTAFVSDAREVVELTGYRLDSQRITPGEPLYLTLYWRAARHLDQPLYLTLRLVDPVAGESWLEIENRAPGGLATDLWNVATQIDDRYTIVPPAGLPRGDYILDVALYRSNGASLTVSGGGASEENRLVIARVTYPPSVSSQPVKPDHASGATFGDEIELVGYDIRERVRPGETLRVALYWHVLKPVPQDYKVFVHLMGPQGEAVVQDDGVPVNWTYPTTRWQPGDTIRDEHILTLPQSAPRGDYQLNIGLYDQADGERPVVVDDAGNELADRLVTLMCIQVR
ncbi:MAG: hypothetical protein GX620_07100 [Chloroflexi bacterium]|nr:hypothetical protein [Chloroflexota bacterium]